MKKPIYFISIGFLILIMGLTSNDYTTLINSLKIITGSLISGYGLFLYINSIKQTDDNQTKNNTPSFGKAFLYIFAGIFIGKGIIGNEIIESIPFDRDIIETALVIVSLSLMANGVYLFRVAKKSSY